MWKKSYDTAARFIAEEKEYNKQRYDKTHKEPDFREGDQVLVLIGKKSVEVQLKNKFSRKHSLFPVSIVKPHHQTGEDKFSSRNKNPTSQYKVEVEDSPGPVKKLIKARKIRLNGKDHRQYLIRFKNQTADKAKWLAEDAMPDGDFQLR
ncbi:hypothetical protein O181_074712 [Austropuccinia psidii MF-1]|uniref:Chromo domain-containing protein n=1 Tax=Austropuccinia psidii MF-1 TaxID=1389203 RepID=A0A9Q3FBE5_9BASI|nr:hypothetical protein [Austropuccinia psidii MF-1]